MKLNTTKEKFNTINDEDMNIKWTKYLNVDVALAEMKNNKLSFGFLMRIAVHLNWFVFCCHFEVIFGVN